MPNAAEPNMATRTQIYRWAYRVLQNHHDALDATQDVLLRALTAPSPPQHRNAWLRRVTVNHCIDLLRRRRTKERTAERTSDVLPTLVADPDASDLRDAVAVGLAELSEKQRAVLVAKLYDHETFATIAEQLGISVSSVKTHYVRALQAMRGPLARFVENPHEL